MGTHQVVVTRAGQAAVQRTLEKLQADVQKCEEALATAEARRDRFQRFLELLDEPERERFLEPFLEVEEALSTTEEVI